MPNDFQVERSSYVMDEAVRIPKGQGRRSLFDTSSMAYTLAELFKAGEPLHWKEVADRVFAAMQVPEFKRFWVYAESGDPIYEYQIYNDLRHIAARDWGLKNQDGQWKITDSGNEICKYLFVVHDPAMCVLK